MQRKPLGSVKKVITISSHRHDTLTALFLIFNIERKTKLKLKKLLTY